MQPEPSYFLQDRGGFIVNSRIQSLAVTPVGILALQNPATAYEIRKLFADKVKVSSNRFVTVEVGIVPNAQVSGGVSTPITPTGSPGSRSYVNALVGNATSPIIIAGAIPWETYYVEATGEDNNTINKRWIVLPGNTLFVRMTQNIVGTASAGLEWRESL